MLDRDQLERLRPLAKKHALLPIGYGVDRKAPIALNGYGLTGWKEHTGFSIEELRQHPHAIAVGLRCDRMFCLDFDRSSSVSWFKNEGFSPALMDSLFVHRDNTSNSFKVLFSQQKNK